MNGNKVTIVYTLFLGQMVTMIMTYKVAFQFRKSVYEYHWSESGYRIVRHESDEKIHL